MNDRSSRDDVRTTTRIWIAVVAAGALYFGLDWAIGRHDALTRTVADASTAEQLADDRVETLGLDDTAPLFAGRPGLIVTWRGVWDVDEGGLHVLQLEGVESASWHIDGVLVHQLLPSQPPEPREVWLDSGFHDIEVVAEVAHPAAGVRLAAAPAGTALRTLDSSDWKPRLPRNPRLRQVTAYVQSAAGWLLAVLMLVAVRRTTKHDRFGGSSRFVQPAARLRSVLRPRAVAWVLLGAILTYGALLRVDAIAVRYGTVSTPSWLAAIQTRTVLAPASIRPPSFVWTEAPLVPHADGPPTRYSSDPYTYLQYAGEVRTIFDAHYREPVYIVAVRMMLGLLDGQDVAVSFTSATFAVLAVWFTYLLGAVVWSRAAGLAAALALAIDRDAVWFSSGGWRDDAYVAAVALTAWLAVRYWRSARRPARAIAFGRWQISSAAIDAVILGLAAGLAILVRFMALSFVAPMAVLLIVATPGSWRRRLRLAALGFAAAAAIAAPYFINCWRVYGDPLYTFNVHANIYSIAEGRGGTSESTLAYVADRSLSRPMTTIDTIARGLTTYPFGNKWAGLEAWWSPLGEIAAAAALLGLAVLVFIPSGRLLLFVALTSLIPFSYTWPIDPNPRFTAHVYPFLLIAAAIAVGWLLRVLVRLAVPRSDVPPVPPAASIGTPGPFRTAVVTGVVVGAVGLPTWWLMTRVSPQLVLAETLSRGEDATISVNAGARAFLSDGWAPGIAGGGNVRMRVALDEGTIRFRLPSVDAYRAILRVDPFPRPLDPQPARLPTLDFVLNGAAIGRHELTWNPERVGSVALTLPREHVRAGMNELVIRVVRGTADAVHAPGLAEGQAFGFWLARLTRLPE